jgi:hypothetical protein
VATLDASEDTSIKWDPIYVTKTAKGGGRTKPGYQEPDRRQPVSPGDLSLTKEVSTVFFGCLICTHMAFKIKLKNLKRTSKSMNVCEQTVYALKI